MVHLKSLTVNQMETMSKEKLLAYLEEREKELEQLKSIMVDDEVLEKATKERDELDYEIKKRKAILESIEETLRVHFGADGR